MDEIKKFLSKTTKKKSHVIFYKDKHTKIKQSDIKTVKRLRTTKCAYKLPLTINNPKKHCNIKDEETKITDKPTIRKENKIKINKNKENEKTYKNHLNLRIKKSLLTFNLAKTWCKESIKPTSEKISNIKKESEFQIPVFTEDRLKDFSSKLKENYLNKKKDKYKNFFEDIKNIRKIFINKKLSINKKIKNIDKMNNSLFLTPKSSKSKLLVNNKNLKVVNEIVTKISKRFCINKNIKSDNMKFDHNKYVGHTSNINILLIIYKDKYKIFYKKSRKNKVREKGSIIGTKLNIKKYDNILNNNKYTNFENSLCEFKNSNTHHTEYTIVNNFYELCFKRIANVIDGNVENNKIIVYLEDEIIKYHF